MKLNPTALITVLTLALSLAATAVYSKDTKNIAADCPPGSAKKNAPIDILN